MKKSITLLLAACLTLSLGAVALADSAWLHVNVNDDEDQISINLPVVLAEAVITMVDISEKPTVIKVEGQELTVPEMREIWEVLKSEGSFTLASIKSGKKEKGDNIDVIFKDNRLLVKGTTEDADEIDINISGDLIDALFSGQEDRLNLEAAIQELKLRGTDSGYVHIREGEGGGVRLWVDNSKNSER